MAEIERLADQLHRTFSGEAWHGPALMELLGQVDAAAAAAHPWHGVHSIWDIVLHISAWNSVVVRRTRGETVEPTHQQDWPAVPKYTESQWQADLAALNQSQSALYEEVRNFPEARLTEKVPGTEYDFSFMLHGAIAHIAYHTGQVALLKKQT